MSSTSQRSSRSPYKDKALLLSSIRSFLNRNGAVFRQQGTRVSEFFEMCCYNNVVEFYRQKQFTITPHQLDKSGDFLYKIKPNGSHENFSFFRVSKQIRNTVWEFDVHHNLQIECAHQNGLFYTADVAVVTAGGVERKRVDAYRQKRSYCPSNRVQTFFEVKHMSAFPELLFSFTGILTNFLELNGRIKQPVHIAPALLISGNLNSHTDAISAYISTRYDGNVLAALFSRHSTVYSTRYPKKTIGTQP